MNKFQLSMLLAAMAVPSIASAQKTRGFPLGEKAKIHVNLDLGATFDSNPDRRVSVNALSDWRASIRPGVSVDVPLDVFKLGLRTKVAIDQYFGVDQEATTQVGGDFTAILRAGGRRSLVGFELRDTLTRTPTFFEEEGTVAVSERRFKQWHNRGEANLVLRPGGGALELRLGYTNLLEFFDDLPDAQHHGIGFSAKLRFLPKTAAIFASNLSFYSANDRAERRGAPYNVVIGLQGQLTPRIAALVSVGFGDTLIFTEGFFSSVAPTNFRTVVAQIDGTYSFGDSGAISVGYKREVRPVITLDSFIRDALSLRLRFKATDRLLFGAFGEYEFRSYGLDERDAQILTVDTRVSYWFFDWMQASVAYQLMNQSSDEVASGAAAFLLEDFTRHQAMLFVGLRY